MGQFFEEIPESLIKWMLAQQVFWVATAPLASNGHVNVSPKGGKYFGVIDTRTFWYMDLTGSGNETIAHIHEPNNGRITILFNAFEGPPRILRLWGKGSVLENGTKSFDQFVGKHDVKLIPGSRSIIIVDIHQVGTSCGFSVPFFDFKEHRDTLNEFFRKKAEKVEQGNQKETMDKYWAYKNAWSMDGMEGMRRALVAGKRENVAPIVKMVGPFAPTRYRHVDGNFTLLHLMLVAMASFLLGIIAVMFGPFVMKDLQVALPRSGYNLLASLKSGM